MPDTGIKERNQCLLSLNWGIRQAVTTRRDEVLGEGTAAIDVPKDYKDAQERGAKPGEVEELHGGDA